MKGLSVALILCAFVPAACGSGASMSKAYDASADVSWPTPDATTDPVDEYNPPDAMPPPEDEVEADFSEPKASGSYVFVANSTEDYVVAIDSRTLSLELVNVGRKPVTLGTEGLVNSAMVINSASKDISIIRKTSPSDSIVTNFPSVDGLESLAISHAGIGAVVFHDFDRPIDPDEELLDNFQDVIVVDLAEGSEEAYQRTCGYMPREVEYDEAGSRGFIVTKAGISIVDFATVAEAATLLPTVNYPSSALDDVKDVDVDQNGEFAVVRLNVESESTSVWVMDLVGEEHVEVVLPAVPYDLDLSPQGDYAVAVMPSINAMAVIPLPVETINPYIMVDIEGVYAGQAHFSNSGRMFALFSNQSEEELVGLFDLHTAELRVYPLYKMVKTVTFTPDDDILLVIHRKEDGPPDDPSDYESIADHSHGYSLLRVTDGYVKQQLTDALPEPFLIHPEGSRIYLMQRDDDFDVREVQIIYTDTFVVNTITLGSPPVSMGYVPSSDKVFVSQDHHSGRITFVDTHEGTQTITGFELNDWIIE